MMAEALAFSPLVEANRINEKLLFQKDLINLLHHETSKEEVVNKNFGSDHFNAEEMAIITIKEILKQSEIVKSSF